MQVLLRHPITGLFYAGGNRWVASSSEALNCVELEAANNLRLNEHLSGTEIMLAYDHPGLRSPFNAKGRAERRQLAADYRGPVPDLRGVFPEFDGAESMPAKAERVLAGQKHRRKAA